MSGTQEPSQDIDRYRSYLRLLARMNLPHDLQPRMDPSDLVQQTLLEAHCSQDLYRGHSPGERAAWLRQILLQNIVDEERAHHRGKRDVAREQSLERAMADSAARLEGWIAAEGASPSEQCLREERACLLAEALESLDEAEGEALIDRYCRGLTLVEIAERRGMSRNAVARLLARGALHLRKKLKGLE
jgi:RNA polymerase sigma-70 factor (ECF subfamily)